jgi:hypothetical protein
MGSILFLKNADFSENAVGNVYQETDITELFTQQSNIVTYDGVIGTGGTVYYGLKSSILTPSPNAYLDIVVPIYRVGPSGDNWGPYAAIGFYDENNILLEVHHFTVSTNGVPGNRVERYPIPEGTKYVLSCNFTDTYKAGYPSGTFLPFSAYLIEM